MQRSTRFCFPSASHKSSNNFQAISSSWEESDPRLTSYTEKPTKSSILEMVQVETGQFLFCHGTNRVLNTPALCVRQTSAHHFSLAHVNYLVLAWLEVVNITSIDTPYLPDFQHEEALIRQWWRTENGRQGRESLSGLFLIVSSCWGFLRELFVCVTFRLLSFDY